jgi:hypothetical protein
MGALPPSEDTKNPYRRSRAWRGLSDQSGFMYRSRLKNQGHPDDFYEEVMGRKS